MTLTELDIKIDPVTGEPHHTHIILPKGGRDAVAVVTEARIYGYPVLALCGLNFVPTRDPKTLPMCPICEELRKLDRPDQDPSDIPPA